ncbi:hypothetical protein DTO063F5_3811 [Paecilomyces variotii]|nr:hypothetical protein DTO063F5_3811 [Paecilomyces variotii]
MFAYILLVGILAIHVLSLDINVDEEVAIDISESKIHTVHNVAVGYMNAPVFIPNRLNANIGDRIIFRFYSLNHTLTQSSLERPCTPIKEFDTGFNQFNPDKKSIIVTLTVNTLEPQWFFCKQTRPWSHCHAGMVFALNPGSEMKSFLENLKRDSAAASISSSTSMKASSHAGIISMTPARTISASSTRAIVGSRSSRLPLSGDLSKAVSISSQPASNSSPGVRQSSSSLARSIIISPVAAITVTETGACAGTPSATSIRRSSLPSSATSDDCKSIVPSLNTAIVSVVLTAVLLLS